MDTKEIYFISHELLAGELWFERVRDGLLFLAWVHENDGAWSVQHDFVVEKLGGFVVPIDLHDELEALYEEDGREFFDETGEELCQNVLDRFEKEIIKIIDGEETVAKKTLYVFYGAYGQIFVDENAKFVHYIHENDGTIGDESDELFSYFGAKIEMLDLEVDDEDDLEDPEEFVKTFSKDIKEAIKDSR